MKIMRVPVGSMEEIKPEPKKHLKLCLYMCPVCHKEFMSTSNGGAGFCLQHIRQKHPEALLPSKAEISLPNLRDKMARIRARAAELFAVDEQ
ncbi:hypothetical protein GPALN_004913 [Globodera pallida]|nr:hypothetical protein GPALN_004913 [Globodera pallida]